MATIYRYEKIHTTGPNGTTVDHNNTEDNEITELATVDGLTYISVPEGVTLPEQPVELDPVLPDEALTRQIANASRLTVHYENFVQEYLNNTAAAYGYGSARTEPITMACSYAGDSNTYQAESQAFTRWRGAVWDACYAMLNDVITGARDVPTVEQVLLEMPDYSAYAPVA